MADVAPVGTEIRCRACDGVVLRLVEPLERGGIIRADAVEDPDGVKLAHAEQVSCPSCGNSHGFYAVVHGHAWWVGGGVDA